MFLLCNKTCTIVSNFGLFKPSVPLAGDSDHVVSKVLCWVMECLITSDSSSFIIAMAWGIKCELVVVDTDPSVHLVKSNPRSSSS